VIRWGVGLVRRSPSNVFSALSEGDFISIVFFSMLAGLALGLVRSPGADDTLRMVNTFYDIFAKVFGWILVPLPLRLFAIVAAAVSEKHLHDEIKADFS